MKIPKLIRNLAQPLPIYAFVKAASKSNGLFIYILPYNNVTQPDLTGCLEWLLLFFFHDGLSGGIFRTRCLGKKNQPLPLIGAYLQVRGSKGVEILLVPKY